MQFNLVWQDVTENLAKRQQPIVLLERPLAGNRAGMTPNNSGIFAAGQIARVGEFWVPASPLLSDTIEWSLTTTGDYARVPMHGYNTDTPARAALLAVGIELGMRAMFSLVTKSMKPPVEVILVLGTEVKVIEGGGYQLYAGVAIRV